MPSARPAHLCADEVDRVLQRLGYRACPSSPGAGGDPLEANDLAPSSSDRPERPRAPRATRRPWTRTRVRAAGCRRWSRSGGSLRRSLGERLDEARNPVGCAVPSARVRESAAVTTMRVFDIGMSFRHRRSSSSRSHRARRESDACHRRSQVGGQHRQPEAVQHDLADAAEIRDHCGRPQTCGTPGEDRCVLRRIHVAGNLTSEHDTSHRRRDARSPAFGHRESRGHLQASNVREHRPLRHPEQMGAPAGPTPDMERVPSSPPSASEVRVPRRSSRLRRRGRRRSTRPCTAGIAPQPGARSPGRR